MSLQRIYTGPMRVLADPRYGKFSNDFSLSQQQVDTIAAERLAPRLGMKIVAVDQASLPISFTSKRYPTPISVRRNRGWVGSASSFWRSWRT